MWRIGDIEIDGKAVLGPMSGITSRGYRDFMKPFGVAVSVTEMTSDTGILHGYARTAEYVRFDRNYPTGLQLFGSDPEVIAKAAAMAIGKNPNIDFFDINMGCPVPKVMRSGSGSILMADPAKCGEIIRAVKRAVDVPVTAKIRLGLTHDTINFRQVIGELEAAGADAVAVHARTRSERYVGIPHYDLLEGLQSEMSVPLIVSGNIYSLDDAIHAEASTGAAGIMVARGGVGNPFLVTQIDRYFRTGEVLSDPDLHSQAEWCLELADRLIDEKGEEKAILVMRSIAPKFISGHFGGRECRRRLSAEISDRAGLERLLHEIEDELGRPRQRRIKQAVRCGTRLRSGTFGFLNKNSRFGAFHSYPDYEKLPSAE